MRWNHSLKIAIQTVSFVYHLFSQLITVDSNDCLKLFPPLLLVICICPIFVHIQLFTFSENYQFHWKKSTISWGTYWIRTFSCENSNEYTITYESNHIVSTDDIFYAMRLIKQLITVCWIGDERSERSMCSIKRTWCPYWENAHSKWCGVRDIENRHTQKKLFKNCLNAARKVQCRKQSKPRIWPLHELVFSARASIPFQLNCIMSIYQIRWQIQMIRTCVCATNASSSLILENHLKHFAQLHAECFSFVCANIACSKCECNTNNLVGIVVTHKQSCV